MLKNQILFLFLICLAGCKENRTTPKIEVKLIDEKNELQLKEEVVEIELQYYGMMCLCPQWATKENIEKYESAIGTEQEVPIDSLFIRIEPENEKTINPFDLDYDDANPVFKFIGRFYERKQKWRTEEGQVFNCRVLKYKSCKI